MDLAWQMSRERNGSGARERSTIRVAAAIGSRVRFVALEPSRSAVLAMVGGRGSTTGTFNRAYQARRQPGSAIKPFVYAAAFASSRGFTPATIVPDTQRTFGRGRHAWRPRNFDGTYHAE